MYIHIYNIHVHIYIINIHIYIPAMNMSSYVYIYIQSLITYIYENIGTITKCLIPFTTMIRRDIRRDPQSEPL